MLLHVYEMAFTSLDIQTPTAGFKQHKFNLLCLQVHDRVWTYLYQLRGLLLSGKPKSSPLRLDGHVEVASHHPQTEANSCLGFTEEFAQEAT